MKMTMPISKPQPWVLPVTLVCLVFGGFIATLTSAKQQEDIVDVSKMTREQISALYSQSVRDNKLQQKDLLHLQARLDNLTSGAIDDTKLRKALKQQLDDLRIQAGVTPVKGPGIVLVLDDTTNSKVGQVDLNKKLDVVHDVDLSTLVNELRSAGMEALDINGQRVTGFTAIRCAGPVILVNTTQVAAPFRITAIGKPDTLYGAVNMPNGQLDWLRAMNIHVEVAKRENLLVPASKIQPRLEYGHPVMDANLVDMSDDARAN